MDIIVTTPRTASADAAQEAEDLKKAGGGFYYRRVSKLPLNLEKGDRVLYVEDGYIRGFARVHSTVSDASFVCETTGKVWPVGNYIMMSADSWKWIKPIKMQGFQGWRYCPAIEIKEVGGWLDPKPPV